MTDEQFESTLAQVLEKLDKNIDTLKGFIEKYPELGSITEGATDLLESLRVVLQYITFDLEATRRERDRLRDLLDDNQENI